MNPHWPGGFGNRAFRLSATLEEVGERAAVAAVLEILNGARSTGSSPARDPFIIGPGDDAAALSLPAGEAAVLTTDTLVEGVHFERAWSSPGDLGYKLIQSAASDVGAMGAKPLAALVSVAAPGALGHRELLALTEGMLTAAGEQALVLAGGDTTEAPLLVLTATVLGAAPPALLRTRAGARPGQRLAITGELGDAAAGLRALKALYTGESPPAPTWLRPLSALTDLEDRLTAADIAGDAAALATAARRFLRPSPPIASGPIIAAMGGTALIDISDGLASELKLLARASDVGVVVDAKAIPVGPGALAWAVRAGTDPLALAFDGGEDYELLFSIPMERWEPLAAALRAVGVHATPIGETVPADQGLLIRDSAGASHHLAADGYEHFHRS